MKKTGEEVWRRILKVPKGKQEVVDITTLTAAAEVEDPVHEDEMEELPGYNLRRGPRQEEPVDLGRWKLAGCIKDRAKTWAMKTMTTESLIGG